MTIKLSDNFLSKNPKFNRKEQQLIIGTLLNKISLTTKRSSVVNIKLRKFGTIHTHGNKKRMSKLKYLRRYNKMKYNENQELEKYSLKKLLF